MEVPVAGRDTELLAQGYVVQSGAQQERRLLGVSQESTF